MIRYDVQIPFPFSMYLTFKLSEGFIVSHLAAG